MIQINTKQLCSFKALAQYRNYSKAAAELGITQPGLSYTIDSLEKEIGTALFTRESTAIKLTYAGETFLPFALNALHQLELGQTELIETIRRQETMLRLSAQAILSNKFLPELVSKFYKFWGNSTDINFHLSFDYHPNEYIKRGDADFAFSASEHTDADFERVPILECGYIAVLPDDGEISAQTSTFGFDHLLNYTFITTHTGNLAYMAFKEHCMRNGRTVPKVLFAGSIIAVCDMVSCKLGAGIVPNVINMPPHVTAIPIDIGSKWKVQMYYLKNLQKSRLFTSFLEFIHAEYADTRPSGGAL